jgi:hypothetical protein
MPSWFARNSLIKMATRASGHISCHEKPKLNDNNNLKSEYFSVHFHQKQGFPDNHANRRLEKQVSLLGWIFGT